MRVTVDEKLVKFCEYVKSCTGWAVTKAKRPMNLQLDGPFCSVGFLSLGDVEKDTSVLIEGEDSLTQQVRGLHLVKAMVQGFGVGSYQALKRLKTSFNAENWTIWSSVNEFGLSRLGDVQDISATLLDSNYEERAQFDVDFYVTFPEEFVLEYFENETIDFVKDGVELGEQFKIEVKK